MKYVFNEPWRFVLKVSPNIIDKARIRDHELEARTRDIENYIEKNDLNGRRIKLVYGKAYRWWKSVSDEKYNERSPLKNKPITRILDELKYDTIHA